MSKGVMKQLIKEKLGQKDEFPVLPSVLDEPLIAFHSVPDHVLEDLENLDIRRRSMPSLVKKLK